MVDLLIDAVDFSTSPLLFITAYRRLFRLPC